LACEPNVGRVPGAGIVVRWCYGGDANDRDRVERGARQILTTLLDRVEPPLPRSRTKKSRLG